jgi:asparagine synthase (glutamine-hydrolysing)
MTALCAWAGDLRGSDDPMVTVGAMLRRATVYADRASAAEFAPAAAAAACGDRQRFSVQRANGNIAVLIGEAEWSNAELGAICRAQGQAAALIEGYRRYGDAVTERARGRCAAFVATDDGSRALAFTDRLGLQPLAYGIYDSGIVVAGDARCVAAHPACSAQLNWQALFDFLFFHHVPAPQSSYAGVRRLLPGERLVWNSGRARIETYWRPRFVEDRRPDLEATSVQLRAVLERATRESIRSDMVGSFLSGGTDSSTLAGLLTRVLERPVPTFSIGFAAEGYDEMAYARIASRHFGTHHHEYYVTPADVIELVPHIAASYSEPFGNSSAVPTYFCARLAREHGVRQLLAGDGGDELFGGNARYATQWLFSLYEMLPAPLRHGLLEPLLKTELEGPRLPLIGKLQSYVTQASIPMPTRTESYNLLIRLGIDELLEPDFLRHVDTNEPARLLDAQYAAVVAQSLINRQLGFDWKFTLADNDIPKVSTMCDLAGVAVSYPFLDANVVDFSLELPPNWKLRGTRLRWFFKHALQDFLPREIIAKKKHGFGLPFGTWLVTDSALGEFAREGLESLAGRGIVRRRAIQHLWVEQLPRHPPFYGGMVWLLLILEHWLRARAAGAQRD